MCLGRIETGDSKGCLKSRVECETETHERSKCAHPTTPFLTQTRGAQRGYETVLLDTSDLKESYLSSKLETTMAMLSYVYTY